MNAKRKVKKAEKDLGYGFKKLFMVCPNDYPQGAWGIAGRVQQRLNCIYGNDGRYPGNETACSQPCAKHGDWLA